MEEVPLILTLFDKAVRQFSLYGAFHPQAQGAIRDLEGRLRGYFGENDRLEVAVKRTHLEWNGTPAFTLEKRENNYIQAMYLDGVRTLEWLPLVTADELKDFISVLARDQRGYESREDDTVTLFWKKGFQNIRYQTVDVHAGDLNALLRETLRDEDMTEEQKNEADYIRYFVSRLVEAGGVGDVDVPAVEGEGTPRGEFAADVRHAIPPERFDRNLDDTDRLYQEASHLSKRDSLSEVGVVFAEVLEAEVGRPSFAELTKAYLSVIHSQIEKGSLSGANDWLKRLRGVQVFLGEKNVEVYAIIDEEVDASISAEFLRELTGKWNGVLRGKPEEWIGFLSYLGPRSPSISIEILAAIQQETLHTLFVEFLVNRFPDEINSYVAGLNRAEGIVVRDMVRVLSNLIDHDRLLPHLVKVAAHPHPGVRLEVIRAASEISAEKTTELLRRGLRDADSDVRAATLRAITAQKPAVLVKALADQVSEETFLDRDAVEKKRTLIALARCGGASTLNFLGQVVKETESGDREQELRIAAIHAIAEIPGPSARALLEEFSGKLFLGKELREAARHLLQRKPNLREESSND